MPQTSFTKTPAAALYGQLADFAGNMDTLSAVVETVAGIDAGRAVLIGAQAGTAAAAGSSIHSRTVKAVSASGDIAVLAGFTIRPFVTEPRNPLFSQYDPVAVLRKGRIWLTCIDDMSGVVPGTTNIYIQYSGANAGLPQAASTTAAQCANLALLIGGTAGALGLFEVALV
jgi:hypothetical protein